LQAAAEPLEIAFQACQRVGHSHFGISVPFEEAKSLSLLCLGQRELLRFSALRQSGQSPAETGRMPVEVTREDQVNV